MAVLTEQAFFSGWFETGKKGCPDVRQISPCRQLEGGGFQQKPPPVFLSGVRQRKSKPFVQPGCCKPGPFGRVRIELGTICGGGLVRQTRRAPQPRTRAVQRELPRPPGRMPCAGIAAPAPDGPGRWPTEMWEAFSRTWRAGLTLVSCSSVGRAVPSSATLLASKSCTAPASAAAAPSRW